MGTHDPLKAHIAHSINTHEEGSHPKSNQRQRKTKKPPVPDTGPEPPTSSAKERVELRKRREDSGGALERTGVRVRIQPKLPDPKGKKGHSPRHQGEKEGARVKTQESRGR